MGTSGEVTWGGTAGTLLSYVAIAYMVYSFYEIFDTQMGTCSQVNMETLAKRQMKNCHFIAKKCVVEGLFGDCVRHVRYYCCFNSPLSRILQEQIRAQKNMPWALGDYSFAPGEVPVDFRCEGLTLNDISTADWDQVNLDEWVGLLTITDNLPTINSDFDIDSMTGTGHVLDLDGQRPDTSERATSRMQNVSGKREELRQEMWNQ